MAKRCLGVWRDVPQPDDFVVQKLATDHWRVELDGRNLGTVHTEFYGRYFRAKSVHGSAILVPAPRANASIVLAHLDWVARQTLVERSTDKLTGTPIPYKGGGGRPPSYLSSWTCFAAERIRDLQRWIGPGGKARDHVWTPIAVRSLRSLFTSWASIRPPVPMPLGQRVTKDLLTGEPFEPTARRYGRSHAKYANTHNRRMSQHLDYVNRWVYAAAPPTKITGPGAMGQVWAHEAVAAWRKLCFATLSGPLMSLRVDENGMTYQEHIFGFTFGAQRTDPRVFYREGGGHAEVRLHDLVVGSAVAKGESQMLGFREARGWDVFDDAGARIGETRSRAAAVKMLLDRLEAGPTKRSGVANMFRRGLIHRV